MFPYKDNHKIICFPHIIGTNTLGGKTYTWNDVTGGARSIGSFGLTTNTFMGGKCLKMGFIPSLGFYGCLNKYDPNNVKLCAFYLDDPTTVTEYGSQMIALALPDIDVLYMTEDKVPKTKEDKQRLAKAQEEAAKHGFAPYVIKCAAAETLESLVKAAIYEKALEEKNAALAAAVEEEPEPVPVSEPEPPKPVDIPKPKNTTATPVVTKPKTTKSTKTLSA